MKQFQTKQQTVNAFQLEADEKSRKAFVKLAGDLSTPSQRGTFTVKTSRGRKTVKSGDFVIFEGKGKGKKISDVVSEKDFTERYEEVKNAQ